MERYKYLIIGGGMTADAAVTGIREMDRTGRIGIISAEPDRPYARPPLSKDLWTGDKSLDDIWLDTEQKGAELVLSRKVLTLDRVNHEVTDDHGDVYAYEQLLLATGGTPQLLQMGGDSVIYYRTRQDYCRLRELAEARKRFAVLGGGFIGAEIAAALAQSNRQVVMVFPESAIGTRLLPAALASLLSTYYEEHGVKLVTGRKPSTIDVVEDAIGVHLENGHVFTVDGIVAGIGIVPETALAEAADLEVEDGIVVDEFLRTSDPRIFAAGDVANFNCPALDQRLRVEHEDNALTMGKTAGRNMAGGEQSYDHLPYFYSDLFDLGYEAVGITDPALDVITDLTDVEDKGCIFYLQEGRVRGVIFWNLFGKVDAGRELISAPGPHTAEALRTWQKERLAE